MIHRVGVLFVLFVALCPHRVHATVPRLIVRDRTCREVPTGLVVGATNAEYALLNPDVVAIASEPGKEFAVEVVNSETLLCRTTNTRRFDANDLISEEGVADSEIGDGPFVPRWGVSGLSIEAEVYDVVSDAIAPDLRSSSGGRLQLSLYSDGSVSGRYIQRSMVGAISTARGEVVVYENTSPIRCTTGEGNTNSTVGAPGSSGSSSATTDDYASGSPTGKRLLQDRSADELRIGIMFNCCGNGILCAQDAALWGAILGGTIDPAFDLPSPLFSGPVYHGMCRPGAIALSASQLQMHANVANYYTTQFAGIIYRGINDLDLILHFTDIVGGQASVAPFFNPGWNPANASPNDAFAVISRTEAMGSFLIEHEVGHLLGMRHNRAQDSTNPAEDNHGGHLSWLGWCFPTIMAYPNACSLAINQGQQVGWFGDNSNFPMNFFDNWGGMMWTQVNAKSYVLLAMDEVAKYRQG